MKKQIIFYFLIVLATVFSLNAQTAVTIVDDIVKEATDNSQLEQLAHELLDVVGPRLVGTPQMQHATIGQLQVCNLGELMQEKKNGENGEAGSVELRISIWYIREFNP